MSTDLTGFAPPADSEVEKGLSMNCRTNASASSALCTRFTPPAFPRPPISTITLAIQKGLASAWEAVYAFSGLRTTRLLEVGMPYVSKSWRAWCSWIFKSDLGEAELFHFVDALPHFGGGKGQRLFFSERQRDLNDPLHAVFAKLCRHAEIQVAQAVFAGKHRAHGKNFFLVFQDGAHHLGHRARGRVKSAAGFEQCHDLRSPILCSFLYFGELGGRDQIFHGFT